VTDDAEKAGTVRFEEWLTLVALPVSVALCNGVGQPFDFTPGSYYRFFLPAIVLFAVLCPAVVFVVRRRGGAVTLPSPAGLVRDWWTLLACFAVYSNCKVLMPLYATRVYDDAFMDAEVSLWSLFFGTAQYPTRWMLEQAGPTTTWLMDKAYVSFFYFYPVTFALVYFGGFRSEFRRLLVGIIVVYYVGAALYLLVPVMGPVYHVQRCPEVRTLVEARSAEVSGGATVPRLQDYLLTNYMELRRNPTLFVTRPFLGIAAFPSLHVAHTWLFLAAARRTNRWLFAVYVPMFLALTVSTIFWGWHWVGDVVAGAVIAVVVDRLVGRWLQTDDVTPPAAG